ncbi:hypothetical protein BHYA_0114g00050 [Botrytis hyacinthi]|uniref:Uncharacterized protein n=1 Tax=Botrytis hyacinthi TaxID=278943 RepID=A0A4Z1GMW8_9HELO|nr:hypothetical protein BHYA_0114g00050 [Botrytis hyacinthi]
MGRKNQKLARKFRSKPRRATPGERRARKEAEETRLQSAVAEAAIDRPVSGANEIAEEDTRDDDVEMGPSGTVDAASAAGNVSFFQTLVSRPKRKMLSLVTVSENQFSPLHLSISLEYLSKIDSSSIIEKLYLTIFFMIDRSSPRARARPRWSKSSSKIHLALRRRAADARRKEARRERRRKECAAIVEELGGGLRDLRIEEEDGDDGGSGSEGATLGGLFGGPGCDDLVI